MNKNKITIKFNSESDTIADSITDMFYDFLEEKEIKLDKLDIKCETALRGILFSTFTKEYFGRIGQETKMTYEDGGIVHTGDVVEVFDNGESIGNTFVCQDEEYNKNYFVMGLYNTNFNNGISDCEEWSIKLVKKFSEVDDGEIIDGVKMILD